MKHILTISSVIIVFALCFALARQITRNNAEINHEKSAISTPADNPTKPVPHIDAALTQKIADWQQGKAGNFGIAVRELTGQKRSASFQPDASFVAASTYKLFVVYAVLYAAEQHKHDITLQQTSTSLGRTVHDCVEMMLVRSDNDCGWPMGNLIGWDSLDSFLVQQGFTHTKLNNYIGSDGETQGDKISTAADQAELLARLANGTLLNAGNTDLMLSYMKRQIWRERIPAGVPSNVEVADKPGWLSGIENDSAIVYGPKSTYVISILSTGASSSTLAELSQLVYNYLQTD